MPVVMLLIAVVLIRGLMWVVARDEVKPGVESLAFETPAREAGADRADAFRVPVHDDARGLLLPAAERAPLATPFDATTDLDAGATTGANAGARTR